MIEVDARLIYASVMPFTVGVVAGILDAWMRRLWAHFFLAVVIGVYFLLVPDGGIQSLLGTINFVVLFFSVPILLVSYFMSLGVSAAVVPQMRRARNHTSDAIQPTNKSGDK